MIMYLERHTFLILKTVYLYFLSEMCFFLSENMTLQLCLIFLGFLGEVKPQDYFMLSTPK